MLQVWYIKWIYEAQGDRRLYKVPSRECNEKATQVLSEEEWVTGNARMKTKYWGRVWEEQPHAHIKIYDTHFLPLAYYSILIWTTTPVYLVQEFSSRTSTFNQEHDPHIIYTSDKTDWVPAITLTQCQRKPISRTLHMGKFLYTTTRFDLCAHVCRGHRRWQNGKFKHGHQHLLNCIHFSLGE